MINMTFLPNLSMNFPPKTADKVNKKPIIAVIICAILVSAADGLSPAIIVVE
jgi:hypothetical protein